MDNGKFFEEFEVEGVISRTSKKEELKRVRRVSDGTLAHVVDGFDPATGLYAVSPVVVDVRARAHSHTHTRTRTLTRTAAL